MSKSVSRVVLAVTAVAALGLVTACGGDSDEDKKSGKSAEQTVEKTPGADKQAAPLSKAALEKAVLAKADVKGFEIEKMTEKEFTDGGEAKAAKAECQPVAQLMGAKTAPAPKASAYVTFASAGALGTEDKAPSGGTGMIRLSSYADSGAEQTLKDLKGAIEACAGGFAATDGTGTKADVAKVESLTAPKLGDEALAFTITDADKKDGGTVKFTVVRSGAHVSVLFGVDLMNPAKPVLPDAVVSAQITKLEKALKA
ncbi:hypothetical protein [Streptomyces sp. ME19-01-6]|uniref:hypothetical protein n=1 Tax=Streptomyces sp. ME19-01-6 TaxID=3028686 RepID=UPI0029B093C3|nr:hypothetical protein [Streptomyces sp. ME19-01-6]MDX3226452.1 hypothetical protein [Streptomyces sp. ME19-01-6]